MFRISCSLSLAFFLCIANFGFANDAYGKKTGKEERIHFFACYEPAYEEIVAGDSMLVNVVLYSSAPFHHVHQPKKPLTLKSGTMRLLPQRVINQQRVRLEQGVYYAIVLQRYMVSAESAGTLTLPGTKLQGDFIVYTPLFAESLPQSPYGFFHQTPYKSSIVSRKCRLESKRIKVRERPKRSTQDVIRSGGRVI